MILSFTLLVFSYITLKAQAPETHEKYIVSGIVIAKNTGQYLHYATVRLESFTNQKLVTGIATDEKGQFNLEVKEEGNYMLSISFLGFDTYGKEIIFNNTNRSYNLGTIELVPDDNLIDDVVIEANQNSIEYKIDKKVIHVSDQYSAISGSAVDVLENVPSIQVDIEGNVSLRGNSNFTVLIDDRPTVLDANDALQQFPASMIQDIEIITNPSAKFDPEGTAGIINIITKKRSLRGLSGIINANIGLDEKYGGNFLLNYRTEKFNFFIGGDYRNANYPGNTHEERRTIVDDETYYLNSVGTYNRSRNRLSSRAGIEFFPNEKHSIKISTRLGSRSMKSSSFAEYEDWNTVIADKLLYESESTSERGGNFYSFNGDYTAIFKSKDHKLDIQTMYYMREGDEESINKLINKEAYISDGQRSIEKGPAMGFRYQINYKQAFSKFIKMELGAQGRYRDSEEINEVYYYNVETEDYEIQLPFSHDVSYFRNIHAAYAIGSGETSKIGYQLGFRSEYTFRTITLDDTEESFNINRWDYFPTAHMSYKLSDNDQLMASYSRRIDRPRGWYLEPFYTWSDSYNVRIGKPGLKPEYINAFELSYHKKFGKNAFSAEIYYRSTENNIERVRSVYSETVTLHTFANVGTDYSVGTELMLNLTPVKWWDISLTGNLYDYRVVGELNDINFDKHSLTWSARMNNIFKFGKNTRIQLNPSYRGPEEEAQEREEGFFMLHAAIRQGFFENKMNLTLQLRDLLATGKHESTIDEQNFYTYRYRTHKAPMLILNLTWKINNYNNKKNNGEQNNIQDEGSGEMEGD